MASSGSLITSSGLTSYAVPGGKLTAVPAANALTISIVRYDGSAPSRVAPLYTAFRSDPASGALYEGRTIIAAPSLVISSGSTLDVPSGTPFRIWVLLFDDTNLPLGAVVCTNITKQFALDESNLLSSTAEGGAGAADSAGVVYTGTAVSSKPFRIIGFLEWSSGLVTAGAWAAAPDAIQMFGPGVSSPGAIVKEASQYLTSVQSGSTVIPYDDTKPQITEGDEYLSVSITPTSKVNYIEHDVLLYVQIDISAQVTMALFKNGTTDALSAAAGSRPTPNDSIFPILIAHRHQSLSTSSCTFSVRAGPSSPTGIAPLVVVNGYGAGAGGGGTRLFGAIISSRIKIVEKMA